MYNIASYLHCFVMSRLRVTRTDVTPWTLPRSYLVFVMFIPKVFPTIHNSYPLLPCIFAMFILGVSPTDVTPRVGVVITDGFSNISPEQTPLAADLAKQFPNPVTMYALGVSGDVNPEELTAIGSIPTENYVNVAPSYDALSAITNHIAAEICMASKCGN